MLYKFWSEVHILRFVVLCGFVPGVLRMCLIKRYKTNMKQYALLEKFLRRNMSQYIRNYKRRRITVVYINKLSPESGIY